MTEREARSQNETREPLHEALGLKKTPPFRAIWCDHPEGWDNLGTVTVDNDGEPWAEVTVEAAYMPAVFFRFTIAPRIGDVQAVTLETGSGKLEDYWPTVLLFANGMVHAEARV